MNRRRLFAAAVRHRPEAEGRDHPADPQIGDLGDCLGDPRRRAMDEAVLDAGARRGQVARRHLDPQPGLAIDAIAQFGPPFDHRLKRWNADPFSLGVGFGDDDVAPHPAIVEVAGNAFVVKAGLGHCFEVTFEPPARRGR